MFCPVWKDKKEDTVWIRRSLLRFPSVRTKRYRPTHRKRLRPPMYRPFRRPAGTVPSAGGGDTEGVTGAESGETAEVYLPVYNGTPVPIRADDRERVTALLREGLRFEQFLPQFETLRRMSAAAGFRRPEELIEQLQHTAEEVSCGLLSQVYLYEDVQTVGCRLHVCRKVYQIPFVSADLFRKTR